MVKCAFDFEWQSKTRFKYSLLNTRKMRHFYTMVFHWSIHYGKFSASHPRHYGNVIAEVLTVNHGAVLSEPV